MTLSIITINLNNSVGLEKTIESVVSQIMSEFEYIIIDGGSTDGSTDIIKRYNSKLTYWISEPDKGIYNAMNKGIMKANGDYCLFLNSGDYLTKNLLYKLQKVDFIEDIIYGNIILFYKDGSQSRDMGAGRNELTFYNFFAGNSIRHQGAFIKRNLFMLHGLYNEAYEIISDWAFFLKVIIFKDVTVQYLNIDIAYFDPYGISVTNDRMRSSEANAELQKILPNSILVDFQQMKKLKEEIDILKIELNRYKHRFKILDNFISKAKRLLYS